MPGRATLAPARGSYWKRRWLALAGPPPIPVRGALVGVGIGTPGLPAQYSTPVFGGPDARAAAAGASLIGRGSSPTDGGTWEEGAWKGSGVLATASTSPCSGPAAATTPSAGSERDDARASANVMGRDDGAGGITAGAEGAEATSTAGGGSTSTPRALDGAAGTIFAEDRRSEGGATGIGGIKSDALGRSPRTDGGAGGTTSRVLTGAAGALERSSGTSRMSKGALSSAAGASASILRFEDGDFAAGSRASCARSRREATSSATADGLGPATEGDEGGPASGFATARRLRIVPAPRRIRSSTTSCVFCF